MIVSGSLRKNESSPVQSPNLLAYPCRMEVWLDLYFISNEPSLLMNDEQEKLLWYLILKETKKKQITDTCFYVFHNKYLLR